MRQVILAVTLIISFLSIGLGTPAHADKVCHTETETYTDANGNIVTVVKEVCVENGGPGDGGNGDGGCSDDGKPIPCTRNGFTWFAEHWCYAMDVTEWYPPDEYAEWWKGHTDGSMWMCIGLGPDMIDAGSPFMFWVPPGCRARRSCGACSAGSRQDATRGAADPYGTAATADDVRRPGNLAVDERRPVVKPDRRRIRGCHLCLGGGQAGEGLVGSDVRIDGLHLGRAAVGAWHECERSDRLLLHVPEGQRPRSPQASSQSPRRSRIRSTGRVLVLVRSVRDRLVRWTGRRVRRRSGWARDSRSSSTEGSSCLPDHRPYVVAGSTSGPKFCRARVDPTGPRMRFSWSCFARAPSAWTLGQPVGTGIAGAAKVVQDLWNPAIH